jgi:hypothetical protein
MKIVAQSRVARDWTASRCPKAEDGALPGSNAPLLAPWASQAGASTRSTGGVQGSRLLLGATVRSLGAFF